MPERLVLETHAHQPDHASWRAGLGRPHERDIYRLQVAELAEVRLPGGTAQEREEFAVGYSAREPGIWSYYPWLNIALRTVEPDALYELRTNRNRNLVTTSEQSTLRQARVAIAGLSVGSNIAQALARHGIGQTFCLADRDDLATSNLNRTHGRMLDVGVPKCQLAARAVLELDPFATCMLYPDGLADDSVDPFVAASDIVLDEVDDFRIKVKLRLAARAHGKPLLMATNLGDSVLIDVERWDRPGDDLEPFNGQLDGVSLDELMRTGLRPDQVSRFAAQVIGIANVPLRALASLPLIGRELVGRPQVASTASIAGGLAALAARSVLLDAPLASGRYRFGLTDGLRLPDDAGTAEQRVAVLAELAPAGQRPELHDPLTIGSDGPATTLRRLARYATLAPSPHNTQPWLFRAEDGGLAIFPDPARTLAVADPSGRALAISLGCAAEAVLVAAAAADVGAVLDIDSESNPRLGLVGIEADRELAPLFPALITRVTDKRGYPPDPVEPPRPPLPDGIDLHYIAAPQSRRYLAELHRRAVDQLASTELFARELAGWLRTDPADPRRDGMTVPPAASDLIDALRGSGKPLIQMGERDIQALQAGPLIGLLTSATDTREAWVRTGLAWLRLALEAQVAGLAVAPLTAIVENPVTREGATTLIPAGQHIQMLFRLGRSPGRLPVTARRDPAWVVPEARQ